MTNFLTKWFWALAWLLVMLVVLFTILNFISNRFKGPVGSTASRLERAARGG